MSLGTPRGIAADIVNLGTRCTWVVS